MPKRGAHYEAAFEDYLRAKGWPYVPVDESKRVAFEAASIKSFDFLVYSSNGPNLLVDVKGRKFHSGVGRSKTRSWENWITRGDVDGLRQWAKVFGSDFAPAIVFAYLIDGPPQKTPFLDLHVFKENHYAFVGVLLEQYVNLARPRSAKWETISVPSADFAATARDIAAFLH